MSMNTRNFGNQNEQRSGGASDQPVDSFDPNVVVQTQDATLANLKPADSTSKVVAKNDYGNRQEG